MNIPIFIVFIYYAALLGYLLNTLNLRKYVKSHKAKKL